MSGTVLGMLYYLLSSPDALTVNNILTYIAGILVFFAFTTTSIIKYLVTKEHTDQTEYADKLLQEATRDPLTNAYNRRHFLQHGKAEFDKYLDQGRTFSVLMFDLDHFKAINDKYGHAIGDIALQHFSRICMLEVTTHRPIGRCFLFR